MSNWSWWKVLSLVAVYVAVASGVRLWFAVVAVEDQARRAGIDVANTYLILPPAPTWWPIVLAGPPVAFLLWRAWRARRG